MPLANQNHWATEIGATIRALPEEWDDRRGTEFASLSSDERRAILRKRTELLSTVGRLMITAILDHGWRINSRAVELVDKAAWARTSERTKLYEQGATVFLGMFVDWYREHANHLPPNAPSLNPLNSQLTGFRSDEVPQEDFTRICEAVSWLLSRTQPTGSGTLTDPAPVWTPRPGYVGRKTICSHDRFRKNGKHPAATTIDGWVKSARRKGQLIDIERDPANGENYYPEAWIKEQVGTWYPRTST